MNRVNAASLLVLPAALLICAAAPRDQNSVFERRIRPLLRAKNPSTCSECHLSGVDLKDFIKPTEALTFAALRAQGLVDVKRPDASRILKLIKMSRPKTPLVTARARTQEYDAFRDWIAAAVRDPKLLSARASGAAAKSAAVVRHARIDSVVDSFERNVWSQEGRCMNCHRPDNVENIRKNGPRVAWFVPDDPEATMRKLIAQGDVDVDHPEKSLLLLKPLNAVPHGGGVKLLMGDVGYKLFRAWLEDYAAVVKGRYQRPADLPPVPRQALRTADTIVMVSGGPQSWAQRLLRVDFLPWDAARGSWGPPIATGERQASPGERGTGTNLIMFLIVPERDRQAAAERVRAQLATPGRYLLRFYCDTAGALDRDYTLPTDGKRFYQGQQELNNVRWFGGWASPIKVSVALDRP